MANGKFKLLSPRQSKSQETKEIKLEDVLDIVANKDNGKDLLLLLLSIVG